MNQAEAAARELQEIDDLTELSSPLHCLNPLSKLLMTLVYIIVTVSFDKYDFTGLLPMVLLPLVGYQFALIPVSTCFRKLRAVLPLVCAVGLANPFFDRSILVSLFGVPVSSGVISMVTLMMKGVFCLMASFLLVAATGIEGICSALRILHVPKFFTSILLLTYRYVSVLLSEVSIMTDAYALRAPNQKGIHISAWGSFLGQLLLRSMDRAQSLYESMLLRGFRGEYPESKGRQYSRRSFAICLLVSLIILFLRVCPPIKFL